MLLRGDYWHYDFIVKGKRYRGSTGFKKNEKQKAKEAVERLKTQLRDSHSVEMIWEQTKRKLASNNSLPLEFPQVWKAFNNSGVSMSAEIRTKLYIRHIKVFCQWMNDNYPEINAVSDVTEIHAQEWLSFLKSQNGANATINDYLSTLKMCFKALGKNYGIIENPFENCRKLPKEQVSREAFTPDELRLIGENATGWIYSLCLTAISTGLREGDICMLKKSSVNLEKNWITVKTRKTKTTVDIPILPGLKAHLAEQIQSNFENDYVFPELAKLYTTKPTLISKGVKEFFEEIGITGANKKGEGYKRNVSTKDVHSFRHTFVYLAACHGVPFPIVQGIVGHTSPEMTKHYMDHANREAKTAYLKQLPDYLHAKKSVPKRNLRERIEKIIEGLTPQNLERNKKRLLSVLNTGGANL